MRIVAQGVEMRAVTLMTARARDVQALQQQTGLKLADLVTKANEDEVFGLKAMEFLAEHNRGAFVTLEELWDRPLPRVIPDADDEVRMAEQGPQEAGQDPTPARSTGSLAATAPAPAPASTEPPSVSSTPSPGSSSRFDPAF